VGQVRTNHLSLGTTSRHSFCQSPRISTSSLVALSFDSERSLSASAQALSFAVTTRSSSSPPLLASLPLLGPCHSPLLVPSPPLPVFSLLLQPSLEPIPSTVSVEVIQHDHHLQLVHAWGYSQRSSMQYRARIHHCCNKRIVEPFTSSWGR
jgi:hypothetical protein